jgi:NitT/TauT family transport system permease protein
MARGNSSDSFDGESSAPRPGDPASSVRDPGARSTRRNWLPSASRAAILYAAIPLIAGGYLVASFGLSSAGLAGFASYLPTAATDVSYSFVRMLLAYALSLGFALAYGYYAATHHTGERVMIPVLDILQSIPILGFFPIALVVLVQVSPGTPIGPNLASIFLIFTSMAWNMVFGVYESLKTLPVDMREAAETFRARGMLLFRKVLFPATINRLVYNTVLSWTAGWFFLVEAEIFSTNTNYSLQGIGSFLSFSASDHNTQAFLAGIVVLVAVIAALDFLAWRPLTRWAERFRYDTSPSGETEGTMQPPDTTGRFRRAAAYVTRGVRTGVSRLSTPLVQLASITVRPINVASERRRSVIYNLALGGILVAIWLMLIALAVGVFQVFSVPVVPSVRAQILQLPLAMGASALRVVAAFAVCLAISIPLAIWISRSHRAARFGMPVVEVIASFPATALFPVIIFVILPYITAEGAAVLMLMTGMIWYLFFNILSGIRALPPDLEEAARSFGLKGRKFLSRVLLPGIFPALITGSITAFGGGWNTLIVAEYLSVSNSKTLSLLGVGQAIDVATVEPNGKPLLVAALFTLVITVVAINELIWKPLYRRAVERYRYD